MKKLLVLLAMVALTAPAFAAEKASDVNVDVVVRQNFDYNFSNDTADWDFGLTYMSVKKNFGSNLVTTVTPAIETTATNYNVNIAEVNFKINDLTKGYGDYGIYFLMGQRFNPMYHLEEAYYGGNYYKNGLYHGWLGTGNNLNNRLVELGGFVGGSFLDDMIKFSLGATTGDQNFGNNFADATDGVNSHLFLVVNPLKGMGIGDLALGVNLQAAGYSTADSDMAIFLGYKHEMGLTAYVEYIQTYSKTAALDKDAAFSFAASFDLLKTEDVVAGLFARFDYIHDNTSATTYDYNSELDAGVQFKWFDESLKTALLYDGVKVNDNNWSNGIRVAAEVCL
jgi:hypothetical protein